MQKPRDIIPSIVIKLAANVGAAGEGKRILSHYKKYGFVPEQYRNEFYRLAFPALKEVVSETQIIQ